MASNEENEKSCIPVPQGMPLFRILLSILPQRGDHHTLRKKAKGIIFLVSYIYTVFFLWSVVICMINVKLSYWEFMTIA
jgi:hypothetical protein